MQKKDEIYDVHQFLKAAYYPCKTWTQSGNLFQK